MEPIELQLEGLLARAIAFTPRLVSGIVIFLVTLYASAWLAKAAERSMVRGKMDPELTSLLKRLVRWGILILGVIQALAQVNFDVTSLIAGLGIAGFTLGFALQDVAKNFVAGVLLILQQPFNVGDAIEVSGFSGTVVDISLRTTELRTWDGRDVLIPNGDVYVRPIVNYSREHRRRVQLAVQAKDQADLDGVTRRVLEAVKEVPGTLRAPVPDAVWLTSTEGAVDLNAYFWVDTRQVDLRQAQNAAVNAVKAVLSDGGFTIKAEPVEP